MFFGLRVFLPLAALGAPTAEGSSPALDTQRLRQGPLEEDVQSRLAPEEQLAVEQHAPALERALAALQGRRAALNAELRDLENGVWTAQAASVDARFGELGHASTLPADGLPSCKRYGCSGYVRSHDCQCDELCKQYSNCCVDFDATCAPHVRPRPTSLEGSDQPYGHPDRAKTYPRYNNFTLWLVEEFDEPIDLDNDPIWTWSDGGLSEGIVRFTKDGIKFEGGRMKIYTTDDVAATADDCSHAEVGYVANKRLSSGELRTKYNLFRYGRYEVRMKAPTVQQDHQYINGNYISTMIVYRDANLRHWREIDIEVTGDSSHSVTTNVISAENKRFWSPDIAKSEAIRTPFSTRQNFHTYAFEWLPDSITWFIDGVVIRTHKEGDGIPIPDLSAKVIMNLWVFGGGGFGGTQYYNNDYPMHSEYEWFRFYRWDGDLSYPCADMTDSCLTEDDLYLTSNNPCDGISQVGKDGVCLATCKS